MLRKIIDGEKLKTSQKNVYDRVFSKVTNLQCSGCNFVIKKTHHRYFLEYVQKTVLKINVLRKKYMVDQLLNKVATL